MGSSHRHYNNDSSGSVLAASTTCATACRAPGNIGKIALAVILYGNPATVAFEDFIERRQAAAPGFEISQRAQRFHTARRIILGQANA